MFLVSLKQVKIHHSLGLDFISEKIAKDVHISVGKVGFDPWD